MWCTSGLMCNSTHHSGRCGKAFRFHASRDTPSTMLRSGNLPVFSPPWSIDDGASVSTGFPSADIGRDPVAPAKSLETLPHLRTSW
jgi:hypothetical protein